MADNLLVSLSAEHLHMLHQSAISDSVISARGYRTVTDANELRELGFAPAQCRVPGLLLPLHGTDGSNNVYTFRPDNPRVVEQKRNGKNPDGTYPCRVIRYEYPKGAPMHVDCPPTCRPLLANPRVRLWITEGQKKADALASQGECVIDLLGVWNYKGRNSEGGTTFLADFDFIAWQEREIVIVFDSDIAVKPQVYQAMDRLRYHLRNRHARVSVVYLPAAPGGGKQGVDDFLAGHTLEDLLSFSDETRMANKGPVNAPGPSQTTRLLQFGLQAQLFHASDGNAFASVVVGDHVETMSLRSQKFRQWLGHRLYAETGGVASAQAMQDALGVLEAHAIFDGQQRETFTRFADLDGAIWLDLADDKWRAVEITPNGWRIVENPPVRFRRARGMLPIPMPVRGAQFSDLRHFVNIAEDDDWIAAASWIHAASRPQGPYPILVVHGEHGSAKSTISRVFRSLIDPNMALLRAAPRDIRDLILAATNGWILALDNISSLPVWLSDGLCRLATGGGFATRQLYTDVDETLFDVQRPVIVNGIEEIATRGDLLDRSIILYLPSIPDEQRKTEKNFWREFETVRPQLLGTLLDSIAFALRELPSVQLPNLPRLADFAEWSVAAAPAMGWQGTDFLRVYRGNRDAAQELVLDASPIAMPLRTLVERGRWVGTATELLATLTELTDEKTQKQTGFPKNARSLSNALRRLAPTLRAVGISIRFSRDGRERNRLVTVENMRGNLASFASVASAASNLSVKSGQSADANGLTRTQTEVTRTQNMHADAKDAEIPSYSSELEEIIEWSA